MTLQKYGPIFREINLEVERFNGLLAQEFRIEPLDFSNSESWSVIANVPWDDQVWPHANSPGVYFLCAHHEGDPSRLGVYVGKATLSKIGNRIWTHLTSHRSSGVFRMNNLAGETFIVEAIGALAFRDSRSTALASALEEFIITGVRDRVHLLNGTGNSA
jgi:hypothetical protein